MRHTIKATLGALLALLALSALVASSASATGCKKGTSEAEHKTLCVEGQQVGSPSKAAHTPAKLVLKAGTTAVLNVPASAWSVACTSVKAGEPEIESSGELKVRLANLKLAFEECKVSPSTLKCTVVAPFSSFRLAGGLLSSGAFKLGSGGLSEEFLELEIKGCILSGLYVVYGAQECSFTQAEVEAVIKELACETSGSKLELRHGQGGEVTLALTGNVELTGESKGKKYSITK